MCSCSKCGGKIGSCKCTKRRSVKSSTKTFRVKDKIIGVILGGMHVTAKELHLIQLAYNDGFQAGRKSRG